MRMKRLTEPSQERYTVKKGSVGKESDGGRERIAGASQSGTDGRKKNRRLVGLRILRAERDQGKI